MLSDMESPVCVRDSSSSPPGSLVAPVAVKPSIMNESSGPALSAAAAAAMEQHRFQLYQLAIAERIRIASSMTWPRSSAHFEGGNSPSPLLSSPATIAHQPGMLAAAAALGHNYMYPFRYVDPRAFYRGPEEPKPQHSYIGLIAMAILSSADRKLVLSDIYGYILENYAYFRTRGPGWRNSIRHNLSLNDCFVKDGRSANGKGHYWAIHPANIDDFSRGDFRRRRAQRRVRKHLGLHVDDDSSPDPSPSSTPVASQCESRTRLSDNISDDNVGSAPPTSLLMPTATTSGARKRQFDVASLLAPDDHVSFTYVKSRRHLPDSPSNALVSTASSVCENVQVSTISQRSTPDNLSFGGVPDSVFSWSQGRSFNALTPPQEEIESERPSESPPVLRFQESNP